MKIVVRIIIFSLMLISLLISLILLFLSSTIIPFGECSIIKLDTDCEFSKAYGKQCFGSAFPSNIAIALERHVSYPQAPQFSSSSFLNLPVFASISSISSSVGAFSINSIFLYS